jgi:plastocyanin
MTRSRSVVLVAIAVIGAAIVAVLVEGGSDVGGLELANADDETVFQLDYVIPEGTAARVAAGDQIDIVPAEINARVGDAIRIVNDDTADHVVGIFFVGSGETVTQRFTSAGVLTGLCTIHASGAFTLRVEE